MQAQGTESVSHLDLRPSLSLATYLAVGDSDSNLIHEFRHSLSIIVPRIIPIPDAIRYVFELVVHSFQGTGEDSMWG